MESFSESDEVEEKQCTAKLKQTPSATVDLVWCGVGQKTPVVVFHASSVQSLEEPIEQPFTSPYRLAFKLGKSDCKIIATMLLAHGFSEVTGGSMRFNLFWSGVHIPLLELRRLLPHQKTNHFPRSHSITRKDRLCQNISKMQQSKGMRHFNIIPKTFIIPEEFAHFQVAFRKHRGTWITKPVSSSRGRGISIINHPNQVKKDEPMVVSQYIERPLCVNGLKFDLRLYVAVTSFSPLRIYLYEEGLTRFATELYSGPFQLHNHCIHLTNYSVNKRSTHYVRCDNPRVDDYGTKWSMSALLRHLHKEGRNVAEMMMKVEDVIIKALIAGEPHITTACGVFQPHRGNCFELFGFDILIDEDLQPWLLEINLSPSLGCDAPIDLVIKSNLIADLFTLVGVHVCDPYTHESPRPPTKSNKMRSKCTANGLQLSSGEGGVVRDARDEYYRRGGFVRIFPSEDSWDLYSSFLDTTCSLNYVLHSHLYKDRLKVTRSAPSSLPTIISKRLKAAISQAPCPYDTPAGLSPLERVMVYMRKLENGPKPKPLWDTVEEVLLQPRHKQTRIVPEVKREISSSAGETTPPSPPTNSVTKRSPLLHSSEIAQLSKLQARKIFAAYLEALQVRLLKETSYVFELKSDAMNGTTSFGVIVSFLRKASRYLSSAFTLVEPSPQLPARDRKKILTKQLAEFILLYKKETIWLTMSDYYGHEVRGVSTQRLNKTLSEASEGDLEQLLALYARHCHFVGPLAWPGPTQPHTATPAKHERDTTLTSPPSVGETKRQRPVVPSGSPSGRQSQPHLSRGVPSCPGRVWVQSISHCPPSVEQTWDSPSSPPLIPPSPAPIVFTKYSAELLESSSLLASEKRSLELLTRSLTASRVGEGGSSHMALHRPSPTGPRADHNHPKRSSSLQLLSSVSSAASGMESRGKGRLAAQIPLPPSISKHNGYVSPYAKPVQRKPIQAQKCIKNSTVLKSKKRELSLRSSSLECARSDDRMTQDIHHCTQHQGSSHCQPTSATPHNHLLNEAWIAVNSRVHCRHSQGRAHSEEPLPQHIRDIQTEQQNTAQVEQPRAESKGAQVLSRSTHCPNTYLYQWNHS